MISGVWPMPTPSDSIEPVVVGLADFHLPAIPEPPDGVVLRHDVWLLPGANGLYDAAGTPIVESFLRRGFDLGHYPHGRPEPVDGAALSVTSTGKELARVVYVPYAAMTHFGHMLTEFAGNLGSFLECPDGLDRIGGIESVLVVPPRAASSIAALSELLSLPANRLFSTASLAKPVRVLHAVIPRPSMMNRHGLARRHFGHVRRLLSRLYGVDAQLAALENDDRGEKLYLSRSQLADDARHIEGEEHLERDLKGLGWRIVYPEQLSLADQLGCLAAARTIAGGVGSALHLLMAFGESFGRRRLVSLGQSADLSNPNVALQAARQGLPFRHLVCMDRDPASKKDLRLLASTARVAACLEALAADHSW